MEFVVASGFVMGVFVVGFHCHVENFADGAHFELLIWIYVQGIFFEKLGAARGNINGFLHTS